MKLIKLAACIASASLLVACGSDSDSSSNSNSIAINMENAQKVLETNADIAYAAYSDSVTTAKALKDALATLKAEPTAENLVAAKKAWLVSREPYGQTEVYRFRNSPIDDNPNTDEEEDGPEGDLNAWPLGEALIDYVVKNDTDFTTDEVGVTANSAGINDNGAVDGSVQTQNIIGTPAIEINAELIANTATADDEHDVIAGYHAIEFLLWGQDLNQQAQTTNGANRDEAVKSNTFAHGGQRPLADFVSNADNDAAARRHQYLEVAVDKLIADLEQVRDEWKDGVADNYRASFTTLTSEADAKTKLTEILVGMGTLSEGELAGERMQIAFSANSQEDEHSCFSDNTHRDIWLNAEGVSNSFFGEYAGYDANLDGTDDAGNTVEGGYGISDYLADAGLETLATEVAAKLTTTETNYKAIDAKARAGEPFDVLIMDANRTATDNPVSATIISLNAQSTSIQEIADELGLGDVVEDDASECNTQDPTSEC